MATRLLVADDDRDIRELFTLVLEGAGFEVLAVADGRQALDAARDGGAALVISDVWMPQMSGLDLCRALRTAPETSALPVIMVSAHGQLSAADAARAVGAEEYLVKPCSPRRLVERVRTVLARHAGPGSGG